MNAPITECEARDRKRFAALVREVSVSLACLKGQHSTEHLAAFERYLSAYENNQPIGGITHGTEKYAI